jgi:excinuclease UvrABC nuclease subunit
MDRQPRILGRALASADVPCLPGVYAWYLTGRARYIGKAADLNQRVWGNHMGRGLVMTGSAFRRNVAQHLGIATAADIKARRYSPTRTDADRVVAWILRCQVAWIVCASPEKAIDLEQRMKEEWMPPLTRI